ncbi:MBL fold metallo-hydrolase [Zoogloea sp.]|uniref:quinoprotein relay system zinc metallohydrolase 1 n=1 Tax=Zoogloea sp. TaxID=49181 RepID=UPI001415CC3D|nr:MAG: quinoprotein relay system zinc metallohydrolase 1 [Zoogloea sp.]
MKRLILALLACVSLAAGADDFDYRLVPQAVAPDVYVFVGKTEDFDTRNGGNIVNTGFIVAPQGVVVIDTGPSLRYGRQMREAIARVTDKPVLMAINTHHHPDHVLGNQAFSDVPVGSLAEVQRGIASEGNAFAENLFRMSGDWMAGTEVVVPTRTLQAGPLELGGRRLRVLALDGHTGADLALFDENSGVLFAGDLVFNHRAPTTPHARVARWLASLDTLEAMLAGGGVKVLVPGHGPVSRDAAPIRSTRDWLAWLSGSLRQAAAEGLDMNEVLARPLPERYRALPVAPAEYRRSVGHLLPGIEVEALEAGHVH